MAFSPPTDTSSAGVRWGSVAAYGSVIMGVGRAKNQNCKPRGFAASFVVYAVIGSLIAGCPHSKLWIAGCESFHTYIGKNPNVSNIPINR
jgi:hypothetical protein